MPNSLITHDSNAAKQLRVAVIQQASLNNKNANLELTQSHIIAATQQGAQLILLQELHATPYFCQVENPAQFELAEPLDGPSAAFLSALAKRHRCVIVGSIFEKRAAGLYHNTAAVFDVDGQMAGYYRKMHIPDDPGFYEKYYFTPGDPDGFQPVSTTIGKLGILVCWDQWFPEAARLMALAGADILLYPTAIGWDSADNNAEQRRQLDAWITIQRAHAIGNHLPVMVANRVGLEADPTGQTAGIHFWGNSFICGQQGELLVSALNTEKEAQYQGPLLATIDLSRTEQVRRIWPYFRDRRIDAYQDILRRFRD